MLPMYMLRRGDLVESREKKTRMGGLVDGRG